MSKVKVALLGNMNNNFFTLARYLRDMGYDARLFTFPYEPAHFHPETDTFTDDFTHYVRPLQWGNAFDLLTTSAETIKKDVGGFDYYIASGTGPAYLAKAGISIDLFIPYGSDLYDSPFFKLVRPTKLWHYFVFTRYQQKGIRTAACVNIPDNSALFKEKLSRIGFTGKRLFTGIPIVYASQFSADKITQFYSRSAFYPAFRKIRQEYDLIIFHHSRHCWKNEPDPVSLKDNDKLFRGFAKLLETSGRKAAIITFEYGNDVEASRQLCKTLGIEQHVFWFPLMPRKEIMMGISLSDVVAGEFRNSWFTYGVVFEAMVLSKPVMHYRDDSLYSDLELYPMIYARTSEDISQALGYYIQHKDELAAVGNGAHEWFTRNVLRRSMDDIIGMLSVKKSN
jgi:hypothetical protein